MKSIYFPIDPSADDIPSEDMTQEESPFFEEDITFKSLLLKRSMTAKPEAEGAKREKLDAGAALTITNVTTLASLLSRSSVDVAKMVNDRYKLLVTLFQNNMTLLIFKITPAQETQKS